MPARPSDDDAQLVAATIAGDKASFAALVKRHDAALRGLAFSMMGSQAAMDDVLQDAYLKAYVSLASFQGKSSFKTWIFRIVHNAAIDAQRKASRSTPIDDQSIEAAMAAPVGPTSAADTISQRLDIDAALAALPAHHREVVVLIDGEGFDYADAARVLGVSPGTVSSRIHQARKSLRAMLASSYFEGES